MIRSFGNVIAYATGFGEKWKSPGTIADEPNVMFDNKVWFTDGAQYHKDDSTAWVGNRSYNNALVGFNVSMVRDVRRNFLARVSYFLAEVPCWPCWAFL